MHYAKWKNPNPKGYNLWDFVRKVCWKFRKCEQIYSNQNQMEGFLGMGGISHIVGYKQGLQMSIRTLLKRGYIHYLDNDDGFMGIDMIR